MSRSVSWRRVCSDAINGHQEEASNATIFILREIGPTGFLLKDEEENKKFKVFLGDPHSCTCGKFTKEKELCKHISWVLLKKFRVPRDNQLSWQLGLVEREINEVLRGIASVQRNQRTQQQTDSNNPQQGDTAVAGDDKVAQRPINDDDVCPICQDEFTSKRDPVTYCRNSCGNNVHIKCMKVWTDHEVSENRGNIRCPYCRETFASLDVLRKEFRSTESSTVSTNKTVLHYGVMCDKCQTLPIPGKCYRCTICSTIYLCQACFNTPTHTHHNFEFREKPSQRWHPAHRDENPEGLPQTLVTGLMNRELGDQDYDVLLQLDSANAGPLSELTTESLDLLPVDRVSASSQLLLPGVQCRVCFRAFQAGDRVRGLPCKHRFHKDCIDPWLLHRLSKCPIDGIVFSNESIRVWKEAKTKLKHRKAEDANLATQDTTQRVHPQNSQHQPPDLSALQISAIGYGQVAQRALPGLLVTGVSATSTQSSTQDGCVVTQALPVRTRMTTRVNRRRGRLRSLNTTDLSYQRETSGDSEGWARHTVGAASDRQVSLGDLLQSQTMINNVYERSQHPPLRTLPDPAGVSLLTTTKVNLALHSNYYDDAFGPITQIGRDPVLPPIRRSDSLDSASTGSNQSLLNSGQWNREASFHSTIGNRDSNAINELDRSQPINFTNLVLRELNLNRLARQNNSSTGPANHQNSPTADINSRRNSSNTSMDHENLGLNPKSSLHAIESQDNTQVNRVVDQLNYQPACQGDGNNLVSHSLNSNSLDSLNSLSNYEQPGIEYRSNLYNTVQPEFELSSTMEDAHIRRAPDSHESAYSEPSSTNTDYSQTSNHPSFSDNSPTSNQPRPPHSGRGKHRSRPSYRRSSQPNSRLHDGSERRYGTAGEVVETRALVRERVAPSIPGLQQGNNVDLTVGITKPPSTDSRTSRGRLLSRPLYRNQNVISAATQPSALYIGKDPLTQGGTHEIGNRSQSGSKSNHPRSANDPQYRWGAVTNNRDDISMAGNSFK